MAQLVKNPPATWETWVLSLGWEDPLEKGKATHSSILAQRISWIAKSQTWLSDFHFTSRCLKRFLMKGTNNLGFHPSFYHLEDFCFIENM